MLQIRENSDICLSEWRWRECPGSRVQVEDLHLNRSDTSGKGVRHRYGHMWVYIKILPSSFHFLRELRSEGVHWNRETREWRREEWLTFKMGMKDDKGQEHIRRRAEVTLSLNSGPQSQSCCTRDQGADRFTTGCSSPCPQGRLTPESGLWSLMAFLAREHRELDLCISQPEG